MAYPTVPDWGRLDAKIVLVGEAPGKWEMIRGQPFVGPSGGRLEVWWRKYGLKRADFYITNVLNYQPDNIDKVPEEEMRAAIDALLHRLAKLEDPWLIVPTGNYALYALTGKGKVSFHHKDGRHERPGITDWRGSILSVTLPGRECVVKVIPTLHPAFVLRTPGEERKCLHDWQFIAEELNTREIALPQRFHHIKPTLEDVEQFVADAMKERYLSVDIETPKKWIDEVAVVVGEEKHVTPKGKKTMRQIIEWRRDVKKKDHVTVARYKSGAKKGQMKTRRTLGPSYIGCIGLAYRIDESLTVPTTKEYWGSEAKLHKVLGLLEKLLTGPEGPELVMQNGMFDAGRMRWEFGWDVSPRWKWDTRAMHHTIDPRDQHDLAYMASIYTRQPFWKHEAKDPDDVMKYASNSEALWTYNGIDVCVTLEIFYILHATLRREGQLDFYRRHYTNLKPILLDMLIHGIRVDEMMRANERIRLDAECSRIAGELETHAGMSLTGDSGGFSNAKLAVYLYDVLKLPKQTKRGKFGEYTVTTDEIAVRRLLKKYPKQMSVPGPMILEHRRNTKTREFLDEDTLDFDKRMRCQYSFCTEAGRLSSQSTPWGTGRNLQNIDRELRYVFIPDK